MDGMLSRNRLAKTVLSLKYRAIDTGIKSDKDCGIAYGICTEGMLAYQLPRLPGIWIG